MRPCLRNLKNQQQILGFEVVDFFVILGIGLGLQKIYGNNIFIWVIVLAGGIGLRFIKRRTAPGSIKHFLLWFFRAKRFTAIDQTKGNISLNKEIKNVSRILRTASALQPH